MDCAWAEHGLNMGASELSALMVVLHHGEVRGFIELVRVAEGGCSLAATAIDVALIPQVVHLALRAEDEVLDVAGGDHHDVAFGPGLVWYIQIVASWRLPILGGATFDAVVCEASVESLLLGRGDVFLIGLKRNPFLLLLPFL